MIDTNHQVNRLTMVPNVAVPLPVQSINNCPPPSRIFQGRQAILDKMHKYFDQDTDDQHIFLLHGLGGAGKTQIALKFIKQALNWFSDIFLIDTSTWDTIDTGLKNIAVTKSAGTNQQDALRWLNNTPAPWLLFFDNADDPKINLNQYFPKCSHGNILITSRNPALCVYAGAHSLVSDMEESDAIVLLLTSAAEETTLKNKGISAEIVKALWYLPLAIIQAGAFIAKSGALNTYLALYTQNKACLLSEKPTQSHDDYTWTVYTTWQISFQQLRQPAATLLQLCSFLHHQGIYEGIFSGASMYKPEHYCYGPSQEELQKPLEILAQFLRPDGTWDSLSFVDSTNELRAYSLISFNMETGLFSIHPLVHSWSQSTLINHEAWYSAAASIVGMSVATTPNEDKHLMSLKMLSHIESLMSMSGPVSPRPLSKMTLHDPNPKLPQRHEKGQSFAWVSKRFSSIRPNFGAHWGQRLVVPDFNWEYGTVYYYCGKLETAETINAEMVENRKQRFGDSHVATLTAMAGLASTYHQMGEFEEAEKLGVLVVEERKKILGEDHPHTLLTMSNLALTYHQMGRLEEAEKLGVLVVEKQKKILGEDHPGTLWTMNNLAFTYYKMGRLEEAEQLEVLVVEKRKKILGDDHRDTLWTMANLARTYHQMGRLKEAEELKVTVLEKRTKLLGEDNLYPLWSMSSLEDTYCALGKMEEAESMKLLVEKANASKK
ncbi:P-loop containing nucleoside triphosphate hydrolase protein [Mycena galericulata]|nr:P-loop containing nucleoside triphosphate hydrolase protein [Mycena galericulata]